MRRTLVACPPELHGVISPAFETGEEADAWTDGYLAGYRAAKAKNDAQAASDLVMEAHDRGWRAAVDVAAVKIHGMMKDLRDAVKP